MSFIKNILLKIGSGFLYGVGFAAAIFIASTVSLSYYSQKPLETEDEMMEIVRNDDIEENLIFKKYDESAKLVAEVTKERISTNEFTLIGHLKNEGESHWSYVKLKAEIFNKNGEFIDQCSEFISDRSPPGSSINFKISCGNCSKLMLEDYHSYKLSITDANIESK